MNKNDQPPARSRAILRNPYAKAGNGVPAVPRASNTTIATALTTRTTVSSSQKRTDRPWETTDVVAVVPVAPPQHAGTATASTAIQTTTATATNRPSTSSTSLDASFDFDGTGIDWNEAARLADAAVLESKQVSSPAPHHQTVIPTTSISCAHMPTASSSFASKKHPVRGQPPKPLLARLDSSSPRINHCDPIASSPQGGAHTSHTHGYVGSALHSTKPPMPPAQMAHQNQQQPVPTHNRENTVASIRPAAWTTSSPASSVGSHKKTKASAASPSSNASSSYKYPDDPRQISLPRELQFSLDSVQPVSDDVRTTLVQHAAVSAPLDNGWTLYSHQKRAVLAGILWRRHILALDMGLGKTLIGGCWARAFCRTYGNKVTVYVLCPVSLKNEWKRTMEEAVGLTVAMEGETVPKNSRKEKNNEKSTPHSNVIICSWGKVPVVPTSSRVDPKTGEPHDHHHIVVADEAHMMQSMTAARTKDALKLMLAPSTIGVLLLTGTPMKNGKPVNLFPLLKAVRHPFGRHQRAYEAHFCGGRDVFVRGGCVWQAKGSANLDQLRQLTKTHMLYLTKEECLKLPPQTRVFKTVPVSSRSQLKHEQAMEKLSKVYESRNDPNKHQEAVLGAVQNLRMVDSLAKVDASVKVAMQVLEKEPAIVIFSSFVVVAKMVHKKLGEAGWTGELLTGETPAPKRQGLVDNFQSGISPVFVCTFGAGGVGLTLTAAHTVVLLDRPWTPGDAHQAEDRVRRIGQTKPVTSIWMTAFELDRQIDAMLDSKSATSTAVLSNKADSSESSSAGGMNAAAPKLSIMKLLQSVLPPTSKSIGLKQSSILSFSQTS